MTFSNNLKGYSIVFLPQAKKDLAAIDRVYVRKIERKLIELTSGAQNADIKKIEGRKLPTFRLRVGNYRIIYEVHHNIITVLVIHVGHRKDIYDLL